MTFPAKKKNKHIVFRIEIIYNPQISSGLFVFIGDLLGCTNFVSIKTTQGENLSDKRHLFGSGPWWSLRSWFCIEVGDCFHEIHGLPMPKGRLVKVLFKPKCRDSAIYFHVEKILGNLKGTTPLKCRIPPRK